VPRNERPALSPRLIEMMPFRHPVSRLGLIAVLSACSSISNADDVTDSCGEAKTFRHYRQGRWWITVSESFQVCSLRGAEEANVAACRCEAIRAALSRAWQLSANATRWRPRCQVILYPDARSYVAAVGGGSEATIGSSLVKPRTGPIIMRRIDLRADVPRYLEVALPHELCHLLVADRFRDRPAPLWYDEGMALLADQPEKLKLHERDLSEGLRRGTTFRLQELMSAETYPASDRMGVFYGQCAALTQLLLTQGTPRQLHEFATIIPTVGANDGLRSTYGIDGISDLERRWANSDRNISLRPMASLLPSQYAGERFEFASVTK
jgi:hypothetical protein